jgi:hypothetical protein
VLLVAPFTSQIRDPARWERWCTELGGGTVRLVWVRSDAVTLHARLTARGSGRDSAKLADFAAFTASMRPGTEPAAPHFTVDNRAGPAGALEAQVTALVRDLPGR